MEFVNLTRNVVRVFDDHGDQMLEIPPESYALTAEVTSETVWTVGNEEVANVPVVRRRFQLRGAMPPPREGVIYIVGSAVLMALAEAGQARDDLVAPDTGRGSVVYGGSPSRIVGVKQFRIV